VRSCTILALALDERGINHLSRRSFPTSMYTETRFRTWRGETADPGVISEEDNGLAYKSVDVAGTCAETLVLAVVVVQINRKASI
jgi:hypothetical protein